MLWLILSEWYIVVMVHASPWQPIYCQVKEMAIIFKSLQSLGSAILETASLFYILIQQLIPVTGVSAKWEKAAKDAV